MKQENIHKSNIKTAAKKIFHKQNLKITLPAILEQDHVNCV